MGYRTSMHVFNINRYKAYCEENSVGSYTCSSSQAHFNVMYYTTYTCAFSVFPMFMYNEHTVSVLIARRRHILRASDCVERMDIIFYAESSPRRRSLSSNAWLYSTGIYCHIPVGRYAEKLNRDLRVSAFAWTKSRYGLMILFILFQMFNVNMVVGVGLCWEIAYQVKYSETWANHYNRRTNFSIRPDKYTWMRNDLIKEKLSS